MPRILPEASRRQIASLFAYLPILVPHVGRRLVARYNRKTGLPGVVDNPIRALFFDPGAVDPEVRRRLIEVSADVRSQLELSLGILAHEVDATTRRVGFAERDVVGGAVRDAQAAVPGVRGDHA